MSKAQAETQRRLSYLCAALSHAAGKRVDKSLITHDSQTTVAAQVQGTVGRAKVDWSLRGSLNVGTPTETNAGRDPKVVDVVACLLQVMPDDSTRAAAIDAMTKHFKKGNRLKPSQEMRERADAFVRTLRTFTSQKRAATISFQVSDEA